MRDQIVFISLSIVGGVILQPFILVQIFILYLFKLLELSVTCVYGIRFKIFHHLFVDFGANLGRVSIYLGAASVVDFVWHPRIFLTACVLTYFTLLTVLQVCKRVADLGWLKKFPRFSYWVSHV